MKHKKTPECGSGAGRETCPFFAAAAVRSPDLTGRLQSNPGLFIFPKQAIMLIEERNSDC